jgi:hypothetical protein
MILYVFFLWPEIKEKIHEKFTAFLFVFSFNQKTTIISAENFVENKKKISWFSLFIFISSKSENYFERKIQRLSRTRLIIINNKNETFPLQRRKKGLKNKEIFLAFIYSFSLFNNSTLLWFIFLIPFWGFWGIFFSGFKRLTEEWETGSFWK